MNWKNKYQIVSSLIVITLVLLTSCDRDNNSPGYVYFPDMTYSRAYETYSENENFKDGQTMREPVEGTIPRGFEPFAYKKTEEGRTKAGLELTNPFKPTEENIARGKERFVIYCIHCHGKKGDGTGYLYTSGSYAFQPRSLLTERVQDVPDGEIFHVITLGYGVMGAHGFLVPPEDRWKIALYIQNELGNESDTAADSTGKQ
jgi:mono/diheme cytochrome c family protein